MAPEGMHYGAKREMEVMTDEKDRKMSAYHGIVINISQKDPSILNSLEVIGRKAVLPGFLVLDKICVQPNAIEHVIQLLQRNMRDSFWPFAKGFYFHLYRNDELIIVFKDRIFRVTTDPATWAEAIEFGLKQGIPKKQLDFDPCRIADERY